MNLQQLMPWNWFKHEEASAGATVLVKYNDNTSDVDDRRHYSHPVVELQKQMDRLFEQAFRGFGLPYGANSLANSSGSSDLLTNNIFSGTGFRPHLNVGSDDQNYHISVEAPGLSEKDISLEINNGVLTIRGEKSQETENKDRHYYRVERSYGQFRRVLALPEDCDAENITATMKDGVLDIVLPRKALPNQESKKIPINSQS